MTFRLKVLGDCKVPLDQLERNAATCEGLRRLERRSPHGRPLAIVGGGPSIIDQLDVLRHWPGEVWAINNTARWLTERHIRCKFFTVDPAEDFDTKGVDEAVIATLCHPALRNRFSVVHLFDMVETDPEGISGGSTSASRAASLAVQRLGYLSVTFFGCESSFKLTHDHVYESAMTDAIAVIKADGKEYLTKLEFMEQAECLSALIRMAPTVFRERSGGLLRAMVEHPDTWEVVAVSAALKANIESHSGGAGIYEVPYEIQQ